MPAPDFSIRLGLVGAAQVLTGIQSVLTMAGQVAAKVRELAEAADAYGDVVSGHVVSVEQARIATNSLIDSITLHQQAARMEAAGFQVTSEQLRALAVAATNYANTTGQDINESFVQLTESVTRCSSRGLRPYGIELERGADRAQQQQAVVRQLTDAYGDQTAEIEGTADAIASLETEWTRAWNEMLLSAETNAGPLRTLLRGITAMVTDLANALETQREAQEHIARMGREARIQELQRDLLNAGYDRFGERNEGVMPALQRTGIGLFMGVDPTRMDDIAQQAAEELARLEQADIDDIRRGRQQVVSPDAPAYAPDPDAPDRPGGGGRGTGDEFSWEGMFGDLYTEGNRWTEERNAMIAETYRGFRDEMRDFWVDFEEEQKAATDRLTQAEIDANEARLENERSYLEQQREMYEKQAEARQELIDKTQSYAQTIAGVYNTLAGSIGDFAATMADTEEEQKRARGGTYIAEQVGALLLATTLEALYIAQNNVAGAITAGAAIVAAGIGIAKTATEFGVQSKSGAGGGSKKSGSRGEHQPEMMVGHRAPDSRPTTVVHINGVVTSAQVNEELMALQRDSARAY